MISSEYKVVIVQYLLCFYYFRRDNNSYMIETKRFMRFVLPGLVYLILLAVAFFVSGEKELLSHYQDDVSLAKIIAAVIASGGLGYVFSLVYFGLAKYLRYDYEHLNLINRMIKNSTIHVIDERKREVRSISRREESWLILNIIWHSQRDSVSAKGENINVSGIKENLDEYYSDLVAGLGITFIASLFSLFTYLITCTHNEQFCFALFFYFSVLLVIFLNYKVTKRKYLQMIRSAVLTVLCMRNNEEPFKVVLDRSDKNQID